MTQEEFAGRIGITPQAVNKWERGISLPDVVILSDICRVLEVSADELLQTVHAKITEDGSAGQGEEVLESLAPQAVRILSYEKVLWEEELPETGMEAFHRMVERIAELVSKKENYAHMLNREITKILVERIARLYPTLVQELIPARFSYGYLTRVFR